MAKSISFEQGDKSNLKVSVSRNFKLSTVKALIGDGEEDVDSLGDELSFVNKCSQRGKGFEGRATNLKCLVFFSFENVFNFEGGLCRRDYDLYMKDIVNNFEECEEEFMMSK